MLSHETAAELWGLLQSPARLIHVTVPADRILVRNAGVVVHRSRFAERSQHPGRRPWRTRVEDTVVDLTQTARRLEDAIAWLARAIGGRFTSAPRLRACLDGRPKLKWRAALSAALRDVDDGSHSPLELAYLRNVERAHGLPRSQRQMRRASGHYDDVRYPKYGVRVELDGRAAHPEHERWRDMRRDNAAAEQGDHVLRYGSVDVGDYPCGAALQVIKLLRAGGWRGTPHRCARGNCAVTP
jgi:very-short-patch-repair endonuclease